MVYSTMIDVSVNHVQKFFGDFQLLKDVDFQIYEGEKVGLIGKNGAGKTTLFHILTDISSGKAKPGDPSVYDAGEISIRKEKRVGLIDQIPVYPEGFTVEQVLLSATDRLKDMRERLRAMEKQMETDHSTDLLRRYGELSSRYETEGGYDAGYRIDKVAGGLDIDQELRHRPFELLSGGEKTRVNLARVILEDTDILLLDEPTNHLDIDAVEWLGEYLSTYRGTVLTISHDRYFLDQVVDRIIEIEDGVSEEYKGNYSYYILEKERRFAERLERWKNDMAQKEKLEALARQYRNWATETMMKRAKEIELRAGKLTVADRPRKAKTVRGTIHEAVFYADEALSVRNLSKRFEDGDVVKDAAFMLEGGERAAIYGPNGCGKTTLLRMIVGELQPDSGSVRFGPQTKWLYLPQQVTFERMDRNVLDTVLYERNCSVQAARDALGAYLFTGEDVYKPLEALSGGERARLKLCLLMQDDVNMLILDEPTNHLDLHAREWIEDLLEDFSGVILFVSHDRYFVSRFATRVLDMHEGELKDYKCGFEEYRERVRREKESAQAMRYREEAAQRKEAAAARAAAHASPGKAISKAKRHKESLEKKIGKLENLIAKLDEQAEANATDYEKLAPILEEKTAREEELLELYEEAEEAEKALNEMQG